ncbi:hypothetical protein J7L27_05470 [Candidatus Bathyarchaeota archaeon]|nr:hypothetical protein [Candidatus Bathyarchaeota archaeon]
MDETLYEGTAIPPSDPPITCEPPDSLFLRAVDFNPFDASRSDVERVFS